jgi:hypothetical protein
MLWDMSNLRSVSLPSLRSHNGLLPYNATFFGVLIDTETAFQIVVYHVGLMDRDQGKG